MATKSLNISLPEELKSKAQQIAIDQNYGSIGRYIQHLLRKECEKLDERKKLEYLLNQGINQGFLIRSHLIFLRHYVRN